MERLDGFLDEERDSKLVGEQERPPSAFNPARHEEEGEDVTEGCDLEVLGKTALDSNGQDRWGTD